MSVCKNTEWYGDWTIERGHQLLGQCIGEGKCGSGFADQEEEEVWLPLSWSWSCSVQMWRQMWLRVFWGGGGGLVALPGEKRDAHLKVYLVLLFKLLDSRFKQCSSRVTQPQSWNTTYFEGHVRLPTKVKLAVTTTKHLLVKLDLIVCWF